MFLFLNMEASTVHSRHPEKILFFDCFCCSSCSSCSSSCFSSSSLSFEKWPKFVI